jgi:hypothetical protein
MFLNEVCHETQHLKIGLWVLKSWAPVGNTPHASGVGDLGPLQFGA